MADQRARIDLGDDGDAVVGRGTARPFVRAPVAGDGGELAHDQAFDIGLGGFVVVSVGAVVADLRVGEDDDLAGIGRIGEDFLIAGDGGIEDDFAGAFGGRTKTPALEDRSVFQGEDCGFQYYVLLGVGNFHFSRCGGGAGTGHGATSGATRGATQRQHFLNFLPLPQGRLVAADFEAGADDGGNWVRTFDFRQGRRGLCGIVRGLHNRAHRS